jgi:hypothetical protein
MSHQLAVHITSDPEFKAMFAECDNDERLELAEAYEILAKQIRVSVALNRESIYEPTSYSIWRHHRPRS